MDRATTSCANTGWLLVLLATPGCFTNPPDVGNASTATTMLDGTGSSSGDSEATNGGGTLSGSLDASASESATDTDPGTGSTTAAATGTDGAGSETDTATGIGSSGSSSSGSESSSGGCEPPADPGGSACDPLSQDCGAGEMCIYVDSMNTPFQCVPEGSRAAGEPCCFGECSAGLLCQNSDALDGCEPGDATGCCVEYCDPTAPSCSRGGACVPLSGGVGYCEAA